MLKYYHSRIKLERIIEEDKEYDCSSTSSSSSPSPVHIQEYTYNPNGSSSSGGISYSFNNRNSTELHIDESFTQNPPSSDEEQNTPPIPTNPSKLNNILKNSSNNDNNSNGYQENTDLNGYYQLALGLFPLCPSLYNVFVRYEEIDVSLGNILLLTNRVKMLSNLLNKKSSSSKYELSVDNLAYRIDFYKINSIQISEICSMCLEVSRLMSYVDPVFRNPMDTAQLNKILILALDLLRSIKTKLLQLYSRNGCSLIKKPNQNVFIRPNCSLMLHQEQQQQQFHYQNQQINHQYHYQSPTTPQQPYYYQNY